MGYTPDDGSRPPARLRANLPTVIPKPMSGQPAQFNATPKSPLKRKRAPVWPLATRHALETALEALIERGTVYERTPKDEWSVHPSTETRGSAFQWERWVWGCDDLGQWKEVKLR